MIAVETEIEKVRSTKELSSETLKEIGILGKKDLYFFSKGICGFDWLVPRIHKPLCRLLELYEGWNNTLAHPWAVYRRVLKKVFKRSRVPREEWREKLKWVKRHGLTRCLITLPRGWLKTTICSQAYPLWRATRNPEVRILLTQNTYGNSCAKGRVIGDIVLKNQLYRCLYPELLPDSSCTWREDSKCLKRKSAWPESTFEFAGTRTQVTSRHYDVIIEDDTVAPAKSDLGEENVVPAKEDVVQAIGWHRLTPPLLLNAEISQNLVVGTRWFVKDLISWVMDNEADEYVFYMRACREDKFGKPDEDGEVTYKERFNERVLVSLKKTMGPYLFSCLYMNKPVRSKDMIFQQEWFRFYDTIPSSLICYTTVDPANDPEFTKGDPDYNVVVTCGKDLYKGLVYILEYSREKCSPGRLIELIENHVRKYHPVKVGIETVQYQSTLQYWIKERKKSTGLRYKIEPIPHTKRSKTARILGLQPVIYSGNLLFAPWMTALMNELVVYPYGPNDDIADALATQLELWRVTSSVWEDRKKKKAEDPLSVDNLITELVLKAKRENTGLFDPDSDICPIPTFYEEKPALAFA